MSTNVSKMRQNLGVEKYYNKMVKYGQKWHVEVENYFFWLLHYRMIMTLFSSFFFTANETIADKILIGQRKSLPPDTENCQFWKQFFLWRKCFEITFQFSWNFQEMLNALLSRRWHMIFLIRHDPFWANFLLWKFAKNGPRPGSCRIRKTLCHPLDNNAFNISWEFQDNLNIISKNVLPRKRIVFKIAKFPDQGVIFS